MYIAATFLTSLLFAATAFATPSHGVVRRHQHAALAKARAAAPDPVAQPLEASAATPKKLLRKRCKARMSSALSSTPAASSSPAPASSSAASSPSAANLAPSQPPSPPPAASAPAHSSSASASSSAPPPPPSQAPPPPPPPPAPSPSSSPAPAPSPSGGGAPSPSLFTGTQTGGDGTFYGTGLGACGITNHDTDHIAAVSKLLFDHVPGYNGVDPNSNPVCNKKVKVSYQGKSTTVTITDRCEACQPTDLDFSPAAFNDLADPSVGRIHGITWTWE